MAGPSRTSLSLKGATDSTLAFNPNPQAGDWHSTASSASAGTLPPSTNSIHPVICSLLFLHFHSKQEAGGVLRAARLLWTFPGRHGCAAGHILALQRCAVVVWFLALAVGSCRSQGQAARVFSVQLCAAVLLLLFAIWLSPILRRPLRPRFCTCLCTAHTLSLTAAPCTRLVLGPADGKCYCFDRFSHKLAENVVPALTSSFHCFPYRCISQTASTTEWIASATSWQRMWCPSPWRLRLIS